MKPNINKICSRQTSARAASKLLIALTLFCLALPCLLSAQTLLHRYSFVSDASDSVGGAQWNGTLVGPGSGSAASIANGLTLPGGGGPGYSGYVTLPAGILTNTASITVETWATQTSQNGWAELWSFNNGQNQYFSYIPYPANNNNNMSMALKSGGGEVDALSGVQLAVGSQQYIVATFNANTLVGNLFTNGALVASVTAPNSTYTPGVYGALGTLNNVLGQDPYNDPQFQGVIYEFRIWNGVVSQRYQQASALEGPTVLINQLTPTSVSVTAGPAVVVTGTEQATVNVTLPQTGVASLLATLDATNWVSSNPSVLTVNSSGIITGAGTGTATVSATVAGVTATSGTITVAPQTLLHRYSFVSDASDSVGGANGTIVPGSVTAGGSSINNGLSLPGSRGGNGQSDYLSLPAGILTNTTSITVECWLTQSQANGWAEAWDFGNNGDNNFALIPNPGNNSGNIESVDHLNGNNPEVDSNVQFPNGSEQYVTVTYNDSTHINSLYLNGTSIGSITTANAPGNIGGADGTTQNNLGNDVYGDSQFDGIIYEFRIWNGAVYPVYLAASAVAGSASLSPTPR